MINNVDIQAEREVILSAITQKKFLNDIILLEEKDFTDNKFRTIFSGVRDMVFKNIEIDLMRVKKYLVEANQFDRVGGEAFFIDLIKDTFHSRNILDIIDTLKRLSQKRQLAVMSQKINEMTNDNTVDAFHIASEVEKNLAVITATNDLTVIGIGESIPDEADKLYYGKYILSGIKTIDNKITGFFPPCYTIIGARPSMGKSTLALQIAENNNTLFISLEMPVFMLSLRMVTALTGLEINKIRSGKLSGEEKMNVESAIQKIKSTYANIKFVEKVFDIDKIIATIRRSCAMYNIDIIVIDYLQLITGGQGENRNLQIADISRRLARETIIQNKTIILLSQLSRAVESRIDGEPKLSDLRDSGAIEQDADLVMFLHCPNIYKPETVFKISKNRNGACGRFNLYFDRERYKFYSDEFEFNKGKKLTLYGMDNF